MKRIFTLILLIPIVSFSQDSANNVAKKKIHGYAMIGPAIELKKSSLGVKAIIGFQPAEKIGFGFGIENFKINEQASLTAFFGEFRFFIPTMEKIHPFFALQAGQYSYNYNIHVRTGDGGYINVTSKGNAFGGGSMGLFFGKKRSGPYLSFSYKSGKIIAITETKYHVAGNGSGTFRTKTESVSKNYEYGSLSIGIKI